MSRQKQFLQVVSVDEAKQRFESQLDLQPLGRETVPIDQALNRRLADDLIAPVNVPNFDRSNFDGYAIRSADVMGASETKPVRLAVVEQPLAAGVDHRLMVESGTAIMIATGAKIPRGCDAILMIEDSHLEHNQIIVQKSVAAGFGIAFAGSDIASGQMTLYRGTRLTSRETGILASVGMDGVSVWKQPRVAVISTGDELIAPGQAGQVAKVFDSNARIISDAVVEVGGVALEMGIAIDQPAALESLMADALETADVIILTGGTSKGEGDLSYQVVDRLENPGMIVHGVSIKPGKPVCLAVQNGKPIAVLPGFPTSAIFTFHQFVAPVIRKLAAEKLSSTKTVPAELAQRVNSAVGRTEFNLVALTRGLHPQKSNERLIAHPIGKGSGSVTTFSQADGFFSIDQNCERVDANQEIEVQLLSAEIPVSDFVFIGSHCPGVDFLMSQMQARGVQCKSFFVGSMAGLQSVQQFRGHVCGIHLLDEKTGEYNRPFLNDQLRRIPGYRRRQGLIFRVDDLRFEGVQDPDRFRVALDQASGTMMANRNVGSGTRIIIDQLLQGRKPAGYANCLTNHHATVAAVGQGRADWGVAIESAVGKDEKVAFVPIADELYDFVVHRECENNEFILLFAQLLSESTIRSSLKAIGLQPQMEEDA